MKSDANWLNFGRCGSTIGAAQLTRFKGIEVDILGVDLRGFCNALIRDIASRLRLARSAHRSDEEAQGFFYSLPDGEFILSVGEFLRLGFKPRDVEFWKLFLNDDRTKRAAFLQIQVEDCLARQAQRTTGLGDQAQCIIPGTGQLLTLDIWNERAKAIAADPSGLTPVPAATLKPFVHSGDYVVSAIASLYKGGAFIEKFLENITAQTIFDKSELIIIDAASPEGESEIIANYQKRYPNIVYRRMDERIGIYAAWNRAIQMARGTYITNTNLDDLRRCDSFALQAAMLDDNEFADVTYQDVFFSLDASLSFEEVARFGFKSAMPVISANSLLAFNAPHNAPMWRKNLHEKLGTFDASFASAGDYEFWLRCFAQGIQFIKGNVPHVVYFQNPAGISTRPDGRGMEESRAILGRYCRKLISDKLLVSRGDFVKALGASERSAEKTCYDLVQQQLVSLRDECHAHA